MTIFRVVNGSWFKGKSGEGWVVETMHGDGKSEISSAFEKKSDALDLLLKLEMAEGRKPGSPRA